MIYLLYSASIGISEENITEIANFLTTRERRDSFVINKIDRLADT